VSEEKKRVRLRQAVLAATELEPVAAALKDHLGLGEPFRDPGVGAFGLANTVFALGDRFLEVVSPTQPNTAAGRYMARRGGDCGYMAIFDIEDLDGAVDRARQLGVRVVWEIDLPDIATRHLHPVDMRGAIVSLDRSSPYGTWRWGGPEWTGQTGRGAPGRLAGIDVAVSDPAAVAARWAQVLGVPVGGEGQPALVLEDAEVRFLPAADESSEGLVEIAVELEPGAPAGPVEVGGVRIRTLGT
jgi:Glyoxalase-like domain